MTSFSLKTSILYDQSFNALSPFARGNVFIVCDPYFVENNFIQSLKDALSQANAIQVYDQVSPDPTLDSVIDALTISQKFQPDVMIALGGGSAIDLAKAILYFAKEITPSQSCSFIAIPSTSGTGSEVTSFAVVTDTKNKKKIPIISDQLLPDIAFLNASLVEHLPKSIVAHTGMDALTHALEALVSTNASIYSNALAMQALKIIQQHLLPSYQVGSQHRAMMHQGATMAGIAFNHASLGINHAIAHQLGAIYKIPHGWCNALLLPHVIRLNSKNAQAKEIYNQLAYDLHLTSSLSPNGYRQLIQWIEKYKASFKIESRLSELRIDKNDYFANLDLIASNALADPCMQTNPLQLTYEEMKTFLKGLY